MSNQDYYQLLGIDKSATAGEIKKAYLKMAKKYHPDQNKGDDSAEHKFKEVNEAYEVLKDEQKKAAYDRYGHDAFKQGGGASAGGFGGGFGGRGGQQGGFGGAGFEDIFGSDFFSDFMGGGARQQRRASSKVRGSDLTAKLTITLEEAFSGTSKELTFTTYSSCTPCNGQGTKDVGGMKNCSTCGGSGITRMQQGFFAIEQTCQKCQGSGQEIKNPCGTCHAAGRVQRQKKLIINVPSGIEDGVRIRHAGEGEAGIRGGTSGDLYVYISVKPHDIYEVKGSNLHFKLPLSFTRAALGGTVKVPTIDGGEVELKIPAGTETGNKLRLNGKGMSIVRSSERGDLYAHAFVQTPKNLTKKQKEMLQELDKEIGDDNATYEDPGFFAKMKNLWS